eukprot:SAG22_NODE_6416_length_859_cov_0.810526_1_plen_89_part_00
MWHCLCWLWYCCCRFEGYSWQIVVCPKCNQHIGWRFELVEDQGDGRPAHFFGILATEALVEQSTDEEGAAGSSLGGGGRPQLLTKLDL